MHLCDIVYLCVRVCMSSINGNLNFIDFYIHFYLYFFSVYSFTFEKGAGVDQHARRFQQPIVEPKEEKNAVQRRHRCVLYLN